MAHSLTLHYSVQSGGDGSAYPIWFDSQKLAELDQEWESEYGEGWGEPCTGHITLHSDSPISVIGLKIQTKESVLQKIKADFDSGWVKEKEYLKKKSDLENLKNDE